MLLQDRTRTKSLTSIFVSLYRRQHTEVNTGSQPRSSGSPCQGARTTVEPKAIGPLFSYDSFISGSRFYTLPSPPSTVRQPNSEPHGQVATRTQRLIYAIGRESSQKIRHGGQTERTANIRPVTDKLRLRGMQGGRGEMPAQQPTGHM